MLFQRSVWTQVALMLGLVMAMLATKQVEASDSWSPAGSMSTPRTDHTATLLLDGRVLVSGGSLDGSSALGSAEIYNPAVGTWSPAASMSTARFLHTATLLQDGRVLVTGGVNLSQQSYASAEIYDPARGTWSMTGSMRASRYYHTATLLADGRVLVSGGSPDGSSALGSTEIYNPALGTWSLAPSMSTARFFHTATLLQDGRVLASGGQHDWNSTADAEIYDPALGTWSLTGAMTAARETHTATLLSGGQLLVSGGAFSYYFESGGGVYVDYFTWGSAEIYDPVSGTWRETGSMRKGRYYHESTLLADGRVLVSGGYTTYPYSGNPYLASAELYDPRSGIWSPAAVMSTPRVGHTTTLLPDGLVLVGGGVAAFNTVLASGEIYSPGEPGPDDATAPQVSCAAAGGSWRNTDVTIACTANDVGSGLANLADASFTLTTNVPIGMETANAVTNSRSICDNAGNCSTAGPFTGNKVDKKAPTITIASPSSAASYGVNVKVVASYACSDGGAGTTSCAGSVANGSLASTSPMGNKTFVVTATDAVGNSSTRSVTYTVTSHKK